MPEEFMSLRRDSIVFGPVPSRRLGRSLGINNIPAKTCSFSCVYCQVGATTRFETARRRFYDPEQIVREVNRRLTDAREAGEPVDQLTFVADGEPTLDICLGREIGRLKPLGVPVGVITNATLATRDDVRADLGAADWVSLKVDAARGSIWRRVNRPSRSLRLRAIQDGMRDFSRDYGGMLVTETMLVRGINDGDRHLGEMADFIAGLRPAIAYLSVPIRPPAETWVRVPERARLERARRIFADRSLPRIETLHDYEGDAFAGAGDVERQILNTTAVHPLRRGAVERLLSRSGGSWDIVERLVAHRRLTVTQYHGETYYRRRFHGDSP